MHASHPHFIELHLVCFGQVAQRRLLNLFWACIAAKSHNSDVWFIRLWHRSLYWCVVHIARQTAKQHYHRVVLNRQTAKHASAFLGCRLFSRKTVPKRPVPHCVKQAGAKDIVICLTVPKRPVPPCAKEAGASLIAGTLGSTRYNNQSLSIYLCIYQDR